MHNRVHKHKQMGDVAAASAKKRRKDVFAIALCSSVCLYRLELWAHKKIGLPDLP